MLTGKAHKAHSVRANVNYLLVLIENSSTHQYSAQALELGAHEIT